MGLLNSVLRTKFAKVKNYSFTEIAEDITSPHMAMHFKEVLEKTKSFGWGPKTFFWHEFEEPGTGSNASKIIWKAKLVKKDASGNRVYLDTGKMESGEAMYFYFEVNPSDNILTISVYTDNNYQVFSVTVLLEMT